MIDLSYADISSAKALTGTTLDDVTLLSIQSVAEQLITEEITSNSSVTIEAGNATLASASTYITAAMIMQRQKIDGTTPSSYRAGNYSEETKIDSTINLFWTTGWNYVGKYVRKQVMAPLMAFGVGPQPRVGGILSNGPPGNVP